MIYNCRVVIVLQFLLIYKRNLIYKNRHIIIYNISFWKIVTVIIVIVIILKYAKLIFQIHIYLQFIFFFWKIVKFLFEKYFEYLFIPKFHI